MAKDNKNPAISPLHRGKIITVLVLAGVGIFLIALFETTMASNIVNAVI